MNNKSPREMGKQFGQAIKDQIETIVQTEVQSALKARIPTPSTILDPPICSFCQRHKDEVKHISSSGIATICNICIESQFDALEEIGVHSKLKRTIEFKADQTQAGISILNYFSRILQQKYPETAVDVTIQQQNNVVIMEVQTPEGRTEQIEQTLDEYGLVVIGQMQPEELLSDPMHVMELKNELKISAMKLQMTQELYAVSSSQNEKRIDTLEEEVKFLREQVGQGLQQKGELHDLLKTAIKANNRDSRIEKAVSVLIESISKGDYSQRDQETEEAITILSENEPRALEDIMDILKNAVGGTIANVASTSWLLPLMNALPK